MENLTEAILNVTQKSVIDEEFQTIEWRKYIWLSLFWLIAFAGTIGNSVVIWIVVAHKNMRTVTNLLLLNLAVADGLLALLSLPFASFQTIFFYWPFGRTLCKLNEFVASVTICVSVITLTMIAIDRYTAIIYSFKLLMGRGKTIICLILIWIVSIVFSSPNWIYVTTIGNFNNRFILCYQYWPINSPESSYRIVFMIMTYFLPLFCMILSYSRMGSILWGSKIIGEQSERQVKNDLAKQKVVKMMIVVVITFATCWLPLHVVFILNSLGLLKYTPFLEEIYIGTFWFAMSNAMYNPMVYCWMNARFRAGFKKAFRWCPCITYAALDKIHFPTDTADKSNVTETI